MYRGQRRPSLKEKSNKLWWRLIKRYLSNKKNPRARPDKYKKNEIKKYVIGEVAWKGQVNKTAAGQFDSKIWLNQFHFPINVFCRKF